MPNYVLFTFSIGSIKGGSLSLWLPFKLLADIVARFVSQHPLLMGMSDGVRPQAELWWVWHAFPRT